jgi:transcriptional regulator with XRE-family HTH domain
MGKHPPIVSKFARKLRAEREERGFSQESLASTAGLSRNYIGMIERGEANLTLGTIDRLAKALRIESWELLKF